MEVAGPVPALLCWRGVTNLSFVPLLDVGCGGDPQLVAVRGVPQELATFSPQNSRGHLVTPRKPSWSPAPWAQWGDSMGTQRCHPLPTISPPQAPRVHRQR